MKLFRTPVPTEVSRHPLSLNDRILTIGSCFADAIGARLQAYKIRTRQNPFGTLYNPESIHKALHYALVNELPPAHTFLCNGDIHANYDFHSDFSSLNKNEVETGLKECIAIIHASLKETTAIIITYGTAWIYTRMDTGEVVANCHKMPASHFKRSLTAQKKILGSFDQLYIALKKVNPELRFILTVSPVRHIKDTLTGNAVSKSILRATCHSITETYPEAEYFPAYEIMMDELRDYRFYKADMIHPTEEAEEYIWEKFIESYFDARTLSFFEQWKKILNALRHRPFQPAARSSQQFYEDTLRKLEELKSVTDVEEEIARIKTQLRHPE